MESTDNHDSRIAQFPNGIKRVDDYATGAFHGANKGDGGLLENSCVSDDIELFYRRLAEPITQCWRKG